MLALWPLPRWRSARPDPHKGSVSKAILRRRFSGRRLTVRPSAFHYSQFIAPGGVFTTCAFPYVLCCCHRDRLVASLMVEQGPHGSLHLRGQCDDSDIGMAACKKASQPRPDCGVALCQRGHGGSCTLNQHIAQVSATAADTQELGSSAGGSLTRHEAQPCCKVAFLGERRCVADRSNQCRGVQRPDAGNSVKRRPRTSARAMAANSASKEAMRRSSSSQRVRMSPSRNAIARAQCDRIGIQQLAEQES